MTHGELAADLDRLSGSTPLTGEDVVIAAPPNDAGRDYTVLLDLALLRAPRWSRPGPTACRTRPGRTAARPRSCTPALPVPAGLALRAVTAAC